ncbi:MAG: Glu-tRNA(Gln) amidotransferase subunit GatD [Thermoplasmata archaeon]|nr:Glu-tRNA(Gln) amidotransferase subunit GatD [Thermoplasmata archaeon]
MDRGIEIRTPDGRAWTGTLVPSHEFSGDRIVQLKLASGYNIGVRLGRQDTVRVLDPRRDASPPSTPLPLRATPPPDGWVALLTTGGTIASRVDYRTGAVRPVRDEREILGFYPDLERDGPVRVIPVTDRLSEEIGPADWLAIADKIVAVFREGAVGVVVAHGTDTLAFTAAALAFLLEDLPGPVVAVGAQRSPDRPSSDGFTNLAEAVRLARHANLAEVVVLMHEGMSDNRFSIHRATRVRKMHSSERGAFRTRNGPPLGTIIDGAITLGTDVRPRAPGAARVPTRLDGKGELLWFHPGLEPERARRQAEGLRGLVIAGTGLGHISLAHLPWIREAIEHGVVVVMTTQCLEGNADPYVYATGRELLKAGVVYAGDLLPETAFVKLLWALGRAEDPKEVGRLMLADRAGEFEPRHPAMDPG